MIPVSEVDKGTNRRIGMQQRMLEYYKVCSNDDPWLTVTYFTARSNLAPYAFYGKKVKQWIFQKLLLSMIWQQMTEVTRSFCWHQNFVPWGLYAPCPGAIYMYKIMKKMYKIRLQRDFLFETG